VGAIRSVQPKLIHHRYCLIVKRWSAHVLSICAPSRYLPYSDYHSTSSNRIPTSLANGRLQVTRKNVIAFYTSVYVRSRTSLLLCAVFGAASLANRYNAAQSHSASSSPQQSVPVPAVWNRSILRLSREPCCVSGTSDRSGERDVVWDVQ
jgi:hypothetical protein